MIKITFPDNSTREYPERVSGLEIAKSMSNSLAKEVLSITVNGEVYDLTRPIERMPAINLINGKMKKECMLSGIPRPISWLKHWKHLYPGVKLGIGPSIDNGFYYDIDLGDDRRSISENDLPALKRR
jgi:threonyl-tRNA synthetase